MVARQFNAAQIGNLGMPLQKHGDALARFTTLLELWRNWRHYPSSKSLPGSSSYLV